MQVGRFKITLHNHGNFKLDGGSMFGAVPKTLWSQKCPPDDQNRILMATNSLVIEDGDRRFLVDTGCGDKWQDKLRQIYGIADEPYRAVEGVTDLILTHLHFDHAGGATRNEKGELKLNYPGVSVYLQRSNLDNARNPNPRERASYLAESFEPLLGSDLRLTEGSEEIYLGISVHRSDGHTVGLQWLLISDGGQTVAYPSDLVPTSNHIPLAYNMGYDICTQTLLEEKQAFLEKAAAESWIVVFEHDPAVSAGRITHEGGRFGLREQVTLESNR